MTVALAYTPARVVRQLLVDLALGANTGDWSCFFDTTPSDPDRAIIVADTSGRVDGYSQIDGEADEHHGIQVRVRGRTPDDAGGKIQAIRQAMDAQSLRRSVTVEGETFLVHSVTRTGGIMSLGHEVGSKRVAFTVNALVILEQCP